MDDYSLNQTNTGGHVPLCHKCGWIGSVHPPPFHATPKGKKLVRDYEASRANAHLEWGRHNLAVHVPLVPPDLSRARAGLTHLGRFGHS